MAPTPSSSKSIQPHTVIKTPSSKHRINFTSTSRTPNQNPNSTAPQQPTNLEHPIEVIGRIRDYPDKKEKPISILQANTDTNTVRVRADIGYRDFTLDGISFSEEEDLDSFYKKFVESRINGVKLGDKCTIMMYGPTGSGKSHTMFGCSKQPGIVYRSLKDILGDGGDGSERSDDNKVCFVQVTVLEIYNEEIYDLLSSGGGFGIGWPKGGSGSKVRLEVMGKKAKNATYISGTEAGKISKEIQKVEKRRIVKSTLCNDRSSRSHCMIILDVPTVGGRLMLVDMAGSENIEQAGQSGFEAKMQTAKINQGNIALKRVVESIANGDSHVPFRDSKLTMLLQDSFEDDKSKILMILCASPDPKEIHKTICTLEYGAKAKCILRGPHTPTKDAYGTDDSSAVILGSRIQAMDQFINKLQMENKQREREKEEAQRQLMKKEEEVAKLRALIEEKESAAATEEEIELKVDERTKTLKEELEKKLAECQRMAEEFVESERRRMEERILQQQMEVEMLRRRLEEIEMELGRSREGNSDVNKSMEGSSFARKLMGVYADEDPGMVKSMDLDTGDDADVSIKQPSQSHLSINYPALKSLSPLEDSDALSSRYGDKLSLSTVFEEEEAEEEEEDKAKGEDEEVEKNVIEEKNIVHRPSALDHFDAGSLTSSPLKIEALNLSSCLKDGLEAQVVSGLDGEKDASRRLRIQTIFTLCGNHRELSQQHTKTPIPAKKDIEKENSPLLDLAGAQVQKVQEPMLRKGIEHINNLLASPLPLTPLENKLPLTPSLCLEQQGDALSSHQMSSQLNSTPYITTRRR